MGESDPNTPSVADVEELKDKLDLLWEKYLNFLDQYDQAQRQLGKQMSSGFFSLAQANFKNTSRIRYGQDYYDERMQASRRITISSSEDTRPRISIEAYQEPKNEDQDAKEPISDSESKDDPREKQQPTPPTTPPPQAAAVSTTIEGPESGPGPGPGPEPKPSLDPDPNPQPSKPTNNEKHKPEPLQTTPNSPSPSPPSPSNLSSNPNPSPTPTPKNPLNWYGILIPPPLRQSQSSFINAVVDAIPSATNAARSMREVEVEIRRVRKEVRRAEKVGFASNTTTTTTTTTTAAS